MKIRRFFPVGSRLTLALLAFAAATAPLAGQSQREVPPDGDSLYARHPEAVAAIDRLKSPYCPGLMLEVCPSPGGAALRDSLEALADQGWKADQIVEWVIDRHGEKWRAMPKRSGVGLFAWIIPPLAVVVGIGLVIVALRRMRSRREDLGPVDSRAVTPEEEERLREAMKELEAEEEVPFL